MNVSLQETNYDEEDSSLKPHTLACWQLHSFLKAFGLREYFLGVRKLGE